MRWLVLVSMLAGCDKLWQLQHVDEDSPLIDASMDARVDTMIDARPDSIQQTHSNCPAMFGLPYENSQYRYIATPKTWSDAMRFCSMLDDPTSTKRVHLPVLSNDIERSQHVYVNVVGSASGYWIGYSDTKTEGTYLWVTPEQVVYPHAGAWGPSEPSADPGDNCVGVLPSNNDFDSMLCTTTMAFVCECDDFALDPASYTLM